MTLIGIDLAILAHRRARSPWTNGSSIDKGLEVQEDRALSRLRGVVGWG
jgi:hypothetical protein